MAEFTPYAGAAGNTATAEFTPYSGVATAVPASSDNSAHSILKNTVTGLPAASGIPQAFAAGIQQVQAGAKQASSGDLMQRNAGAVGVLKGLGNAAFSPLAPVGTAITKATDAITNIPLVQKAALAIPSQSILGNTDKLYAHGAETAGDISTVTGLLGGVASLLKPRAVPETAVPPTPEATSVTPPPKPAEAATVPPTPAAPAVEAAPTAPPKTVGRTTQTLKPIEGTGAIKTRGLAQGVEANAIEKKLTDTFGDLPEYRQVSMKDQASRAAEIMTRDPEGARAIAMGDKAPPKGVLPESIFVAAEHKATLEGDVQTLKDLANSKLSASATTMGQRIRTLGERDATSPVGAIQEVQKTREAAQKARGQTAPKIIDQIQSEIRNTHTKETWGSFITSLEC